jgi:hypothetical protein
VEAGDDALHHGPRMELEARHGGQDLGVGKLLLSERHC